MSVQRNQNEGMIMDNKKYGKLTVLEIYKVNGIKKAYCQCACGNKKSIFLSNLVSGRTQSCGCGEIENRKKFRDIKNQRFGCLVAIRPTAERKDRSVVWMCQCDCNNIVYKTSHSLLRGDCKSCGCLRRTKLDIRNQRFGKLRVLEPLDKKMGWKTEWRCKCSCGNYKNITYSNLVFHHTKSCGCLKDQEYRTLFDGTIIESLSSKTPSNNTSGVKGVYFSRGKWIAYLTIKRKRIYLGSYELFDDAVIARKAGESKYFEPLIKESRRSKKDATGRY